MTTKLIYTGRGGAFFHIPARDLTEDDLLNVANLPSEYSKTEEELIASGLYAPVETEQAEPKKKSKRGVMIEAAEDGE